MAARPWLRSAAAPTATITICGSIPTIPSTWCSATTAAAPCRRPSAPSWSAQDFPTGAVLPRGHHQARAVSRLRRAAGQQRRSACRAMPGLGGRGGGRGGPAAPYDAGGGEPGYIAPDPKDPDVFFAGGNNGTFMTRLNRRTGELREVNPYPRMFSGEPASALRSSAGSGPIRSSSRRSIRMCCYTSSQHVWRTTNGGQSWDRISGDLTRHDPKTMGDSGGPITHDMNSPEVYGTVFALGPGKTNVNILWAGSDDGLVHVTRDGGKSWVNVTPKDMPEFGRVSQIDASSFDPGGAYIAVKKPLLNDFAPYIFRTRDFGRTWTRIVNGIGAEGLHARGARGSGAPRAALRGHASTASTSRYNDGDTWKSLSLNLPRHPDFGSRRRVELAGDRHARPQLLHPRRSQRRAAGAGSGGVHGCRGPVQAGGRHPRRRTGDGHLSAEVAGEEPVGRDSRRRRTRRADDSRPHGWTGTRRARPRRRGTGRGAWGGAGCSGPGAPRPPPAGRRQGRAGQISRLRQRLTRASSRWRRARRRCGLRIDGARPQSRHVEPELPGTDDVPGHDPVGRDNGRPGGAAGQLRSQAHRRRRGADAAAAHPQASLAGTRATPI